MGRSKAMSWQNAPKGAGQKKARHRGPAAIVALDANVSEEEEDEQDMRRDKISLRREDDSSDQDGEEDEEVMALEDDEEGDEDDEGGDFDEDDEIEWAIAKGGRNAEIAKQAKAIGAKLKLQRREEDEEEDEPGGEREALWGARKKQYYDADTAGLEGSDDEEALKEEEEEVARLEREKAARMAASDYGLEEGEEEEEGEEGEEEEEDTMATIAEKGRAGHVVVESISKQLGDLSAEEREQALLADAPELLALLQDLKDSLAEVRGRIGPLLLELRSGGLATAEGVSYLEAKHLLLLQYCTNIVFYVMLKAEGRPVKDHPVIGRLVELRAYLEKIRPIDKRLQYQVERLVRAAQVAAKQEAELKRPAAGGSGGGGGPAGRGAAGGGVDADDVGGGGDDDDGDATRFGPRRDLLVAKRPVAGGKAAEGGQRGTGLSAPPGGGAEAAEQVGVYRPPKINPVSMEGDVDRPDLGRNEARLMKEARRKAARSTLVKELAEEVAGAPRELRHEMPGFDSLASVKQRQRLEARAAVEEDMMVRVPLSKEEAKKMKQQHRAGMSGKAMLDDFADEVADIVDLSQGQEGGKGSRLAELFSRQKVSQKFGSEPAPRAAQRGGDEDLPRREPLHERRMRYDAVAAKRAAAGHRSGGADDEDEEPDTEFFGGGGGKRRGRGEEDELYLQAKDAAAGRKKARQDKYSMPAMHPPLADVAPAGARGITSEIERNRGTTPHRRKDLKNPRKKHRIKYADAQVRRRGAVQDVRKPAGPSYGGEATGVKSRVVKSRKLG